MVKRLLLLSLLSVSSLSYSMEERQTEENASTKMPNEINTYVVYSHGFGESGEGKWQFKFLGDKISAPVYPDAPGNLGKAVFYTKPAVHTLANHLYDIAHKEDCKKIVLVGRSCGAGTALNCLAKLANYEKNREYFNGSQIASSEDAQKIIAKINNGALIKTAPFLSLRKANAIAIPSSVLAGATMVGVTAAASCVGPSFCEGTMDSEVAKWGFLAAGVAVYYILGDCIKNAYAHGIVRWIMPKISNNNFDPHHADPLQSVEQLRGKLQCPMLLHFNKNDKVLENPDEDTVKVYDALKGDKMHIIITDDSWHNGDSSQFNAALNKFNAQYLKDEKKSTKKNDTLVHQTKNGLRIIDTQPTVQELRTQIRAHRGIIERNAKYAVAGSVLALGAAYKSMLSRE